MPGGMSYRYCRGCRKMWDGDEIEDGYCPACREEEPVNKTPVSVNTTPVSVNTPTPLPRLRPLPRKFRELEEKAARERLKGSKGKKNDELV